MNRCKNCGASLNAAYCSRCGQKDVDLRRPILELLWEVLRETFEIDGRAARTIWTMFSKPGTLTERYLAGQRRRYTPPVRLYLVVSVLFFFVVAWVVRQGILFELDESSADEVRVLAEDLPRLMFLLLPVFALLLKSAYWQRFYFEHLIHALHLHAAAYVVLALLLPLERLEIAPWLVAILHTALFGYLAGYLAISLRRVYGANWFATMIKAAALFFGYATILAVSLEFASSLTALAAESPSLVVLRQV